jgi:PEP-CTERM motif
MQKFTQHAALVAFAFEVLAVLGTSLPAAAASNEVVLLQSNVSARRDSLLNNLGLVAASPFSGLVINMPATYTAMLNTERLDYNSVFGYWLQPLVGTMPKLSGSYLNVNLRDSGDPFGNWNNTMGNWSVIARAARDAGMRGIVFDNEAYIEPNAFTFPGNAANPSLGLGAYQEQFRQRGADVMNAVQSVWKNAEVINLHGPYVSEPTTPQAIRLDQVGASAEDMRGFFFAGMLAAKGAQARVTDGGEVYQYRTKSDFDASVAWRKFAMPQVAGSSVVPAGLRDSWAEKITLSFGLFDQQWRPNGAYPMTPALLEEALFQALMHADSPVWLYAEDNDYLVPGGVDPVWLTAINNAKDRAVVAQVPEPETWALCLVGLAGMALWTRRKSATRIA